MKATEIPWLACRATYHHWFLWAVERLGQPARSVEVLLMKESDCPLCFQKDSLPVLHCASLKMSHFSYASLILCQISIFVKELYNLCVPELYITFNIKNTQSNLFSCLG